LEAQGWWQRLAEIFSRHSLIFILLFFIIFPFIVPYKAGGGYDIYARSVSPYLSKYLKEIAPGAKGGDIIIRNESTAAGRKGRSLIFNAKPDGYTIILHVEKKI
jgi:tripartite-type tricarboxylate transporter receptor subunit TctC